MSNVTKKRTKLPNLDKVGEAEFKSALNEKVRETFRRLKILTKPSGLIPLDWEECAKILLFDRPEFQQEGRGNRPHDEAKIALYFAIEDPLEGDLMDICADLLSEKRPGLPPRYRRPGRKQVTAKTLANIYPKGRELARVAGILREALQDQAMTVEGDANIPHHPEKSST